LDGLLAKSRGGVSAESVVKSGLSKLPAFFAQDHAPSNRIAILLSPFQVLPGTFDQYGFECVGLDLWHGESFHTRFAFQRLVGIAHCDVSKFIPK
jgi:hypothetical protein